MLIKGANTSALNCFATGAGLYFAEAGETSHFYVKAVDRFGNVKIDGGDVFNASVIGLVRPALLAASLGGCTCGRGVCSQRKILY
jgi:hypothetical protein